LVRVIRVLPFLEVLGPMVDFVFLVVSPDGALFLLKAMLLFSGKLKVSVL
jgi:hypothetical protein